MITAQRYGWAKELIDFGMHEIVPRLALDPSWIFSSNRRVGDELRSALADAREHPILSPSQVQWKPA